MHFDLTNFLSGLAGALFGGFVLWLVSRCSRRRSIDSSKDRTALKPWNVSILLAGFFIIGILIALYLLAGGHSK